jgi:hypothetical protein
MKDYTVGFARGRPAILTTDGKIDFDWHRPLVAGEKTIRLPITNYQCEPPDEPGGRYLLFIGAGPPFDDLPVGIKLVAATFSGYDVASLAACGLENDGLTLLGQSFPLDYAGEFVADSGVTITPADGLTLQFDPPWDFVMLTKTGDQSWVASGDLNSA